MANILFLTYQGDMAGSTNSIIYLTTGLAAKEHNIYMGCRRESEIYQRLQGSQVNLLPMTFKGKFDTENMRQIRDAVEEHHIQLINCQSSYDRYTAIFAKWWYKLDVLVVHTRRQLPKSTGSFLQSALYNRGADKIIAVSGQVKRALVKLGIKESKVEVIYNGTPTSKYAAISEQGVDQLKKQYDIAAGTVVIGSVSRHKEHLEMLQALTYIEQPLKVFFVGFNKNPAIEAALLSVPSQHEVIFVEKVSNEEAMYFLKLFQVNVLPSLMEGLSQSLLESMALGTPVVATAAAGNLDLVKNWENGLLYQSGDIKGLSEAIHKLLTDKILREKLISHGKETALIRFNINNTITGYEQLFESMIAQRFALTKN